MPSSFVKTFTFGSVAVVCLAILLSLAIKSGQPPNFEMSAIKHVAVAGASGNVGQPIVLALQAAGFQVTALTRDSSKATFPSGVDVKQVDYASVDSLKSALQGVDAVVSTTASAAVGQQNAIIDASVAVGVTRFIPSEFGINTRTVQHPGLKKILQGKIKTVDYLIEKTKETPSFSWTGLSTGLFFDWGLSKSGLGFNKTAKTARIVDSGNETFSASNFPFIGEAVAAILANPDKTANKYLSIGSFTTTRNQLLKTLEEETGGEKWKQEPVTSAELNKIAEEKLSKGDFSAFGDFLQAFVFGDGGDSALKPGESANALLGLEDEHPRVTLKAWLNGKL